MQQISETNQSILELGILLSMMCIFDVTVFGLAFLLHVFYPK